MTTHHNNYLIILGIILAGQYVTCGVIRRSEATDKAKTEFDRTIQDDTEHFFNDMFKNQIDFFAKVKLALAPTTKRAHDIEAYIVRLEAAIQEQDIKEKDKMWRDTFTEFNKSPLLLNKNSETGLSNAEYEEIIQSNGIQNMLRNFLADVTVYFWKMAKASGKIMEVTFDENVAYFQKQRT